MNELVLHRVADEGDPRYPRALSAYLGDRTPRALAAWGQLDLLQDDKLALFCSTRCPGGLILQAHDLAQALRSADTTIIGGFHSPVERERLTILLRGQSRLIICPARGLAGMRLPSVYRQPLAEGRLLILSPFADGQRRPTVDMTLYRNRFVAALADRTVVVHAEPDSKTDQLCSDLLQWHKPLYTLTHEANAHLMDRGAHPLRSVEFFSVGKSTQQ